MLPRAADVVALCFLQAPLLLQQGGTSTTHIQTSYMTWLAKPCYLSHIQLLGTRVADTKPEKGFILGRLMDPSCVKALFFKQSFRNGSSLVSECECEVPLWKQRCMLRVFEIVRISKVGVADHRGLSKSLV